MTILFAGSTYFLLKALNSPMNYKYKESDKDDPIGCFIFCAILIAFLAFGAGIIAGASTVRRSHKIDMIQRGLAEYDSKTGEWRMKNDTLKK